MNQWRTFECTECGEVEDIDVSEALAAPACECGGALECIDGENAS